MSLCFKISPAILVILAVLAGVILQVLRDKKLVELPIDEEVEK